MQCLGKFPVTTQFTSKVVMWWIVRPWEMQAGKREAIVGHMHMKINKGHSCNKINSILWRSRMYKKSQGSYNTTCNENRSSVLNVFYHFLLCRWRFNNMEVIIKGPDHFYIRSVNQERWLHSYINSVTGNKRCFHHCCENFIKNMSEGVLWHKQLKSI